MKTLFVVSNMRVGGGAENIAAQTLKELHKKGHDVSLLTFYSSENEYDLGGVERFCFEKQYSSQLLLKLYRLLFLFPRKLRSFLSDNSFDVVITHAEDANVVGLLTKRKDPSMKLWTVIHNSLDNTVYKRTKGLHKHADKIITVSEDIKQEFIETFPNKDVQKINNFLDLQAIQPLLDKPLDTAYEKELFSKYRVLINVGRMAPQKNHELLLKTFKKLRKQHKDIKLVILGDGPLRSSLESYVKKNGLQKDVYMPGIKNNVYRYLSRSYAFVLSSRHEGFPMVLLEAAASGLPIVSMDCPTGPKEILGNNEHGLLAKDEKELYTHAQSLFEDRSQAEKYSRLVKQRAKQFDVKPLVAQWSDVIQSSKSRGKK